MLRRLAIASFMLLCALPAAAQSVPAANYSDMWWNPSESGWGISFVQHAGTNQVYAVWYTYDPRVRDASGQNKPLWIVMPGGTWTSPTSVTGQAYVLDGVPFNQSGSNRRIDAVGSFRFDFNGVADATFTYQIAPPVNPAPNDPASGLPAMSGSKPITRQGF